MKCKEYAEIRVLPNLELQTCLLKSNDITIGLNELQTSNLLMNKFDLSWENFTHC